MRMEPSVVDARTLCQRPARFNLYDKLLNRAHTRGNAADRQEPDSARRRVAAVSRLHANRELCR